MRPRVQADAAGRGVPPRYALASGGRVSQSAPQNVERPAPTTRGGGRPRHASTDGHESTAPQSTSHWMGCRWAAKAGQW
eukprot:2957023-Alexandrium_andersonii.AAC.1